MTSIGEGILFPPDASCAADVGYACVPVVKALVLPFPITRRYIIMRTWHETSDCRTIVAGAVLEHQGGLKNIFFNYSKVVGSRSLYTRPDSGVACSWR